MSVGVICKKIDTVKKREETGKAECQRDRFRVGRKLVLTRPKENLRPYIQAYGSHAATPRSKLLSPVKNQELLSFGHGRAV